MRVLFVAQEISYEPQGIMSMSAVLKQAGHDVALTVADIEDPVAYAVDYQPDIVAYSVMTGSQRAYFDMNLKMREAVEPAARRRRARSRSSPRSAGRIPPSSRRW